MFRDVIACGRQPRSHIALQNHADRVAYRATNIRVLPQGNNLPGLVRIAVVIRA